MLDALYLCTHMLHLCLVCKAPQMLNGRGGYLDSEIFVPPTTYISYAKIFSLFRKIPWQPIFIASPPCSACCVFIVQSVSYSISKTIFTTWRKWFFMPGLHCPICLRRYQCPVYLLCSVQYLCSACYGFDVQSACDSISVLWVDHKTGRIVLARTEDEAAKIRELAAKSGKTISRFVVDAVLNGDKNWTFAFYAIVQHTDINSFHEQR